MNSAYQKNIDEIYKDYNTIKNGLDSKRVKELLRINGKN